MMPLTDGMFALERRVDILSPSEIRVSLVPFGNQDRDLSRYISALTSITGVRVTQNVALRLLFEDEDEQQFEDSWSGISVGVEDVGTSDTWYLSTGVHLAQKVLGFIGLAEYSSRAQAENARNSFDSLRSNRFSSALEACLIYVKDGEHEDIDRTSNESEIAVLDKDAEDLTYLLEKQLVKMIYSIMLKLQMMVAENVGRILSLDQGPVDNGLASMFKIPGLSSPTEQHKSHRELRSDTRRSNTSEEELTLWKLRGDILLIFGLVDLAAEKYYDIMVKCRKLSKPFWVASAFECLCCCYFLFLLKKYSVWPPSGGTRAVHGMNPEMFVCDDTLSNQKLLESAKLYYDIAALVWSLPDISRNIIYIYELVPYADTFFSASAIQRTSVYLQIVQLLLAVAHLKFERKFVRGAHFTSCLDAKGPDYRSWDLRRSRKVTHRNTYNYNPCVENSQPGTPKFHLPPWNLVNSGNISPTRVQSNNPFSILRLDGPPDKNHGPCTLINDAASWIENLYLRNFHSIPPYQRVKLEAAIANFYVTVNRPNKLALFAYSVLKEYLDKFLSQGLVQLPGGEIAISSYLRRTANNIELSNGALKNTKLIYELLSSQQQGNESGSPPMLVHIMKVLCLFAAFNNEFDLAAEVVIQIMDRSYKWFSWATQKYLLNKFYAFSNARILKKIRIKQRLSSNKSSVDGFYNRDVIYSPIFGGLIIKSLKVSCLQLSSEVCIGHDTRSTKLSSDILESKYITSVDEMFYLDIVIENQFPFDIFLEKIDVNTEEGEIRVLAAKSNISLFSSNRIQIPIITLKPGVLILKECVFVLLFGGLECIVPIVDAGYHRRDQIRVCVTPLSPLLTFKWGQIDAYEKLTIMEGEVKRIKLIVENIGNAPAIVTHKFCEDVIDKDLPRTRGNSVHTLLRKTFVSISKSPAESRGATCFSDVESFLVKGSQDQNSEFEIPTHESIALDVHILGVEGPIQGDIHLIYSQPASGGALPHYRVLKIHLSAEVKQIFELRDLSIINFDYTASANEYNREAVECLQNRSIHGGAEEDYQCKYVMILFYIRNLQDQGYDITLKVDDAEDEPGIVKNVVIPANEEKLISLVMSKTHIPLRSFYSRIPASVRHLFTLGDSKDPELSFEFWLKTYLMSDFCRVLTHSVTLTDTDPRSQLLKGRIRSSWKNLNNIQGELLLSSVNFKDLTNARLIVRDSAVIRCSITSQHTDKHLDNSHQTDERACAQAKSQYSTAWDMKLYESYTLNVRIDIQNGGSHENLYLAVFIDVKPATFHGSINIPSTTELVYFSGSTRTILPVDRSSGHAFHKVNIIPLFMGKVYISISAKNICIASDLYQSPDTHRPVSLAATNWFVHQQVELSIS